MYTFANSKLYHSILCITFTNSKLYHSILCTRLRTVNGFNIRYIMYTFANSKLYIIYIMRLYYISKTAVPRLIYTVINNYKNIEIKIRFTNKNKKCHNIYRYGIFYNYFYILCINNFICCFFSNFCHFADMLF